MFIPTSGQLDAAVLAISKENSPDEDKLDDAIKDSDGIMSVWLSILVANLGTSARSIIDDSLDDKTRTAAYKDAIKEVMEPKNQKARDAAKEALQAGIHIGLLASETPELTQNTLNHAAFTFALGALDQKGRDEFIKAYNDLIGPVFVQLITLAYGITTDTDLKPDEARDLLAKDVELAKRMGMALAIGLSVGTKLKNPPSDPAKSLRNMLSELLGAVKASGKRGPEDEEIRGGWK